MKRFIEISPSICLRCFVELTPFSVGGIRQKFRPIYICRHLQGTLIAKLVVKTKLLYPCFKRKGTCDMIFSVHFFCGDIEAFKKKFEKMAVSGHLNALKLKGSRMRDDYQMLDSMSPGFRSVSCVRFVSY